MIDRNTAEHYKWGESCDGWHLLRTPELSVIQERMPPNTSEVRHIHRRSRQLFFILSGQATIEVSGELQHLQAHQAVEVGPGTPHQMMNRSGENLEFLVVSCPPSHGDRVEV